MNQKPEYMHHNAIKRAFICLPIIAACMIMSCSEVEVPYEDTSKDHIIDSLTNYIDSLTQAQAEKDKINQSIPQSIVILNKEVTIRNGYIATIDFRVNPSTAEVDLYDFKLDNIDAETKALGYLTDPIYVKKKSVKKSTNESGINLRGQFTMTIEDKGISTDFTENLAIIYATRDVQDNRIEISSDPFKVVSAPVSSLPKVYITTPEGTAITSKTEWLKDCSITIINQNGSESLNMTTSIKGRGNSTWGFPKKPYALKLDSKEEVLGMPKHKRWVLLANWMDRTLLRNDAAFEMGRRIMEWAPRGEFVELYLNDVHQGNYYLCEQIKVDKNRVDVGDDGYIVEFDLYAPSDEVNYFRTPVMNYPVAIKEPDEEVITSWDHPRFLYITDYIGNIEVLLESDKDELGKWEEIQKLVDVDSYIDWWIIHELSTNWEPDHPKSCYMYKKGEGKLYAGPVWDFDWGTFSPTWDRASLTHTIWNGYFFRYPEFKAAVKERWNIIKEPLEGIDEYITEKAAYLQESNEVNLHKWPISRDMNENGDEFLGYEKAINRMSTSYVNMLTIIDTYISNL